MQKNSAVKKNSFLLFRSQPPHPPLKNSKINNFLVLKRNFLTHLPLSYILNNIIFDKCASVPIHPFHPDNETLDEQENLYYKEIFSLKNPFC